MADATTIFLLAGFLLSYPSVSLVIGMIAGFRELNRGSGPVAGAALALVFLLPAIGLGNYVYLRQSRQEGGAKTRRGSLILRYMVLVHAPFVILSALFLAFFLFRVFEHERYLLQHPDPATLDPDGFAQFIDWLLDAAGLTIAGIMFVIVWLLYTLGTGYLLCFLPLVIGLSMVGRKVRGNAPSASGTQRRMEHWFRP